MEGPLGLLGQVGLLGRIGPIGPLGQLGPIGLLDLSLGLSLSPAAQRMLQQPVVQPVTVIRLGPRIMTGSGVHGQLHIASRFPQRFNHRFRLAQRDDRILRPVEYPHRNLLQQRDLLRIMAPQIGTSAANRSG